MIKFKYIRLSIAMIIIQMFNCTIDSNTCVATDNVDADLYKVTIAIVDSYEMNPLEFQQIQFKTTHLFYTICIIILKLWETYATISYTVVN